jgi:hypothetical protein
MDHTVSWKRSSPRSVHWSRSCSCPAPDHGADRWQELGDLGDLAVRSAEPAPSPSVSAISSATLQLLAEAASTASTSTGSRHAQNQHLHDRTGLNSKPIVTPRSTRLREASGSRRDRSG